MKQLLIYILVLFLITITTSSIVARATIDSNHDDNVIMVTGIIKIKGNEPKTFVTLISKEGDNYILTGEKAEQLGLNHQLQKVEVLGEVMTPQEPTKPAVVEVLSFTIF